MWAKSGFGVIGTSVEMTDESRDLRLGLTGVRITGWEEEGIAISSPSSSSVSTAGGCEDVNAPSSSSSMEIRKRFASGGGVGVFSSANMLSAALNSRKRDALGVTVGKGVMSYKASNRYY